MSTTIVEFLCLYAPRSYWMRWYIESIWRVVSVNCGFDGLFFLAEGIWKVHIFRHLFVCFQTSVYTLGEFHKNRNNSTVFEELSVSIVDLRSQISILLAPLCVASKTAFETIKSTIDTSNSSNTVLLFLNYPARCDIRFQLLPC
jgi:hypothetical protein